MLAAVCLSECHAGTVLAASGSKAPEETGSLGPQDYCLIARPLSLGPGFFGFSGLDEKFRNFYRDGSK